MTRPAPRVHLVSLGCPKNWVDSEVMLGHLHQGGYHPVSVPQEADLIVVNTCAFIQKAKEEAIETILEMARWKEDGHCRRLVVTGCLPQRYGDELLDLLPEVDLMLGPAEIPCIVSRLRVLEDGGARRCHRASKSYLYHEGDPRILSLPGPTTYVKIAEGCSNRCSYCAVPMIRGPLQSRPLSSIVQEVRNLVQQGIKEIILVAQDTTAFGMERSKVSELPALLRILDQVDGLEWIRLMYAHPAHVTDELLETLAGARMICPYLDLPIQHVSAPILRRMNRGVGPDDIHRVIDRLREAIPGIYLRTSLIVGFPGETASDFESLLDFIEEIRFQWAGVFAYSREEDTPAAAIGPRVPEAVAHERLGRLMERQKVITGQHLKQWVGQELRVLVEKTAAPQHGEGLGRTAFQAPDVDGMVILKGKEIIPGRIQLARITASRDYDLVGELSREA
jgi:ribosomal protein S12 methylthiotransferase